MVEMEGGIIDNVNTKTYIFFILVVRSGIVFYMSAKTRNLVAGEHGY